MEEEFHWDVICMQEFTDAQNFDKEEISGHPVFRGSSTCGRKRRPAIIVNKTLKACISTDPVRQGNSVAVGIVTPTVVFFGLVVLISMLIAITMPTI